MQHDVEDVSAVGIDARILLGPETKVAYDNWKAITYARKYCGQRQNECGVYLDGPKKTDCAHFMAHALAAGGIRVAVTDPSANLCPWGLTVRNTDLVAALRALAARHSNVHEIGLTDSIIGDIGFLS